MMPDGILSAVELLERAAHRKVRAVVAESSQTADALFDVAAFPRELVDWNDLLLELGACDATVGEYLAGRGLRDME